VYDIKHLQPFAIVNVQALEPTNRVMTEPDSELLLKSCSAAETFPKNLVHHGTPKYLLDAYYERLNETPGRRFCQDGDASLDIWEYYDLVKGAFEPRLLSNFDSATVN
jgi:hypothetical protein